MDVDADKQEDALEIELVCDPTLSYASYQNHVPAIRSIQVKNLGSEGILGLELTVSVDPPIAEPLVLRFTRLELGETRRVSPVDLKCSHVHLAARNEMERGSFRVTARAGEATIATASKDVEILAYDQWAGSMRALPEILAAFSMPNDPAVDRLLGRAAVPLNKRGKSFNGYSDKNRESVLAQVAAIYSAICAEKYGYCLAPASFVEVGQKIRSPERIADGRIATCLDTTMLFASCLEQAGLNAVLLLSADHAWIGCWLVDKPAASATTTDQQEVRKRIKAGELIAIETTLVTGTPAAPFISACEQGEQHFLADTKIFMAIDVAGARGRHILPLPSRSAAPPAPPPDVTPESGLPDLPPLPPEAPSEIDMVAATDTPQGRIRTWENKLLDLSLRNRLLNFKETRGTLPLIVPDAGVLEDHLSAADEFRFDSNPGLMEGADPRDPRVMRGRTGLDALVEHARTVFGNKRLIVNLSAKDLEVRLLEIYLATKMSLEEGGSNTLFIAMGFLVWSDENTKKSYRAPLVLIPVSLKRQSVRGGYSLTRHDDEALVNPTLLQMLKTDNELHVDGLATLVNDKSGIDVVGAWQAFRKAVADVKGWEVTEEVHLGNFSFTKYLMWKDLRSRLEELKKNRVVAHLIDSPHLPYPGAEGMGSGHKLDRDFAPQQLLAPLICDSTQLQAIAYAAEGRDMVLDGPPGTGKSQTIANLIAHFLGHGKTVLFVSEKIAALNVVHTRVNALGLGPFCLELHSAKAQKAEVIRQLADTLTFTARNDADGWEREATRLRTKRDELNAFVELLHREHRNGLTVYTATGTRLINEGWLPATFDWTDPDIHDRAELDRVRELMARIRTLSEHFSNLQAQGLDGVGNSRWSPTWEEDLFTAVEAFRVAVARLDRECAAVHKATGIDLAESSLSRYAEFSSLADTLLKGANVPSGVAQKAFDPETRQFLVGLAKTGRARQAAWESVAGFKATAATLDGKALKSAWQLAEHSWWPMSALGRRAVTQSLMLHREDGKRPCRGDAAAVLDWLVGLNAQDAELQGKAAAASAMLASTYIGLETSWSAIDRMAAWTIQIEAACDAFAGEDLDAIKQVRQQVRQILVEHHRLLSTGEMIGKALVSFREAYLAFREALRAVEDLAQTPRPLCGADGDPAATLRARAITDGWLTRRRFLKPWCLWQGLRQEAITFGAGGVVQALETGSVTVAQVQDFFEYSYQTWWLKRMIDREDVLRVFTGTDHDRKIREFRDADARFQKLTCDFIVAKAAQRVPNANAPVSQDSEVGKLRREAQRQRGHAPIRQLLQQMPTLLTRLKPCMLMSPLSIAQYLDPKHQQFDVVIFDEASQIPVWDAVGAIARGKQLVVAGDPKQLPPTTFFQKTTDDSSDGGDDSDGVDDMESMLDECLAAGLPRQQLMWHYRSRHESLITFSNHTYYGGGLITFPSPVTNDTAVSFHKVAGHYDRGGSKTNRAEADAIVETIEAHYGNPAMQRKSVGVVTFNMAQQQLIQRLLDERRRSSDQLDRAIADASQREPLFIKNLENVQGDERDVILFSITYGPDAAGGVGMNFGPLNQDGGHRRLNVAITRAREAVRIFSTLQPEQIDLARTSAAGVLGLKTYLEFAKKGPSAILERSTPTGREPDSPFEVAVIVKLRGRGWIVHPQVGCSKYRIDLAVVNRDAPGTYLMGVECDGRTYHSSATARDRDRLRQMVLEGLGWRLHRIWSTDWWLDPDREVQRLHEALEARLMEFRTGVAPAPIVVPENTSSDAAPSQDARAPAAAAPPVQNSPSPTPPSRAGEPTTYRPVALNPAEGDFNAAHSDGRIRTELATLINGEGPISQAALFRRVARAWGIGRVGNRIAERLEGLVPRECKRTRNGGAFYWPAMTDPKSWRRMRKHENWEELTCRHIDDVCDEEAANLASWILANNGQMSIAAVSREVCQLVGMSRVTEDASRRAQIGVKLLCDTGRAVMRGEEVAPISSAPEGRPA